MYNPSTIKHIIFDLGGVLLNIDPVLSLNEIVKISGKTSEELINSFTVTGVFEKFDTGQNSPAQFRRELCTIIGKQVDDTEIDRMWNILLLDFPPERVKMLLELKKNYKLYLLSNTNNIHFKYYTAGFLAKYKIPFASLFDELFLSYEIGIHKPDPGIFKYVLEKGKLNASECLFVDDSLPNIEAAAKFGIAGIHITGEYDVTHYFRDGVIVI